MVFERVLIKHPSEILIHAYALMVYWADLYNSEFQGKLLEGIKTLLAGAHRALAHQNRRHHCDSHPHLKPKRRRKLAADVEDSSSHAFAEIFY